MLCKRKMLYSPMKRWMYSVEKQFSPFCYIIYNKGLSMIEEFLNYLTHERAYSLHTVIGYGNDLREFEAYLANSESVLNLEDADTDLVRRILWRRDEVLLR